VPILLDSGILYAFYDRRDAWHVAAVDLIRREQGGSFIENRYILAGLPPEGYLRVYELNRKYRNLQLGFVDAAVLALAEILGLGRIATTDRKDFELVKVHIPIELLPS
jgi:predicted nucleic acid-binding protein